MDWSPLASELFYLPMAVSWIGIWFWMRKKPPAIRHGAMVISATLLLTPISGPVNLIMPFGVILAVAMAKSAWPELLELLQLSPVWHAVAFPLTAITAYLVTRATPLLRIPMPAWQIKRRLSHLGPALLFAPWAVVPVVVVSGLGTSDAGVASDMVWGLFFAVIGAVPMAYIGLLCVGLPCYLLLRRFKLASPWLLCMLAFTASFVLFMDDVRWGEPLVAGLCGAATALAACLLLPRQPANTSL